MRLRKIAVLFIAVCLLVISIPAPAAVTAYVSVNCVQVYKSASSSSQKISKLSYGEDIVYLKKKNSSWAKITNVAGTAVGFCKFSALTATNPNKQNVLFSANALNVPVYRHALTSSKTLGTLQKGQTVTVVATTPDKVWRRIKFNDGYGYVKSTKLTKVKPALPSVMYVTTNIAPVYKSNSTSSKMITAVVFGESVVPREENGKWMLVEVGGQKTGWVKTEAISTANPNGAAVTMYVSTTTAPVRQTPDGESNKLGTLVITDKVSAVAETPDGVWKRIEYSGGYGFVKKARLSATLPDNYYKDPYKGSAPAAIEKVAAIAVAQYGKPYVYGTAGPDTFDCSGFTRYCYEKGTGIKLKRSAYEQGYDSAYQKITSIKNLKRGDIVCFNTVDDDDLSDHTGFYLGGGLFIHASSGAGEVIVRPLTEGYYNRVFSWGLRIIQ